MDSTHDNSTGGGLNLPNNLGIGAGEETEVRERWRTLEFVQERLREWRVPENVVPDFEYVRVTAEMLLTASLTEYTRLYTGQLRWFSYINRLLAGVRGELLEVRNQLRQVELTTRKYLRAQNNALPKAARAPAAELDEAVETDVVYIELKLSCQTLEQTKLELEATAEELSESLKTVSRQIENRKTQDGYGDRNANLPNHVAGRQGWVGGRADRR